MASLNRLKNKKIKFLGFTVGIIKEARTVNITTIQMDIEYTFWYKVLKCIAGITGKYKLRFLKNVFEKEISIKREIMHEAYQRCK